MLDPTCGWNNRYVAEVGSTLITVTSRALALPVLANVAQYPFYLLLIRKKDKEQETTGLSTSTYDEMSHGFVYRRAHIMLRALPTTKRSMTSTRGATRTARENQPRTCQTLGRVESATIAG
ncbi:MAG: hypothetical protein R2849_00880 [Thermomicrobiales bacterium]